MSEYTQAEFNRKIDGHKSYLICGLWAIAKQVSSRKVFYVMGIATGTVLIIIGTILAAIGKEMNDEK